MMGVEIALRSGVSRINLPDVIDLRKKRIKHIEFCFIDNMPVTPSGHNIVSDATANSLYLTLTEANTQNELIRSLPVTDLNQSGNRLFINKIIDLQRSFIDLSGITNPADVTNKSVYLVFMYDEPAVWGYVNSSERNIIQPFEITISGLKTYFTENRDLLNRRFDNILLSLPAVTPSGKSGIAQADIANKFLTLQRNGLQFFSQVPLYMFYQLNQNFQLRLQSIQFDFQNSYIETLTTNAGDLKTIFFNGIINDSK